MTNHKGGKKPELIKPKGVVFIAHHNPGIVNPLRSALMSAHYEVVTASNGHEFLRKITDQKDAGRSIDCFLIADNLPEQDGYKTTNWLRREYSQRVPIILMSVLIINDEAFSKKRAVAVGATNYLNLNNWTEHVRESVLNQTLNNIFHYVEYGQIARELFLSQTEVASLKDDIEEREERLAQINEELSKERKKRVELEELVYSRQDNESTNRQAKKSKASQGATA